MSSLKLKGSLDIIADEKKMKSDRKISKLHINPTK